MELLNILCVFTLVTVQKVAGDYGDRIKNATITWGENLQMEESRHTYAFAPYPAPDSHTELPVTFQAPFINSRDYWNDPARRTGFDYNPYTPPQAISSGFNSLYNFMQQFFGGEEVPQRQPYPSPYRQGYEPPRPAPQQYTTRPYYIPGPKPLRASIQKLEPPRAHFPFNPNAIRPDAENHYPQFVKILNEVLVDNKNAEQEQVLEKPDYVYQYIVPTTYKPSRHRFRTTTPVSFPGSIQDQLPPAQQGQDTRIPYVTDTTSHRTPVISPNVVFPSQTETVPPLDYAIDVRNALLAVTKRPLPPTTPASPLPTTTPLSLLANIVRGVEATTLTNIDVTTNGESGFQTQESAITTIRNELETESEGSKLSKLTDSVIPTSTPDATTSFAIPTTTDYPLEETTTNPDSNSSPVTEPAPLQTQQSENRPISVVTELLNTMEPIEHDRFRGPFSKKLHLQRVTTDSTTSADYVTDLTVEGLTDATAVHANVPRYIQTKNVTSVIGYALKELNATAPPFSNDWSLDAKILEDTNWDGIQPPIPTTTEPTIETTTLLSTAVTTEEPTPVPETTSPTIITTTEAATTITTQAPTTTPTPTLPTTTPTPTLPSPNLPEQEKETVVATRMTVSVSRQKSDLRVRPDDLPSPRNVPDIEESTEEQTTDVTEPITTTPTTTTTVSTTRRARKYQRRKKVKSFTPRSLEASSTEAPVKFGTLSRPFYPKKTRPNATLSFSNRFSERSSTTTERAVPVRSEEETKKRRNLYRRREYPSQLRRSTTENSANDGEE